MLIIGRTRAQGSIILIGSFDFFVNPKSLCVVIFLNRVSQETAGVRYMGPELQTVSSLIIVGTSGSDCGD